MPSPTFFQRVTSYAILLGSVRRKTAAITSTAGSATMYVGERCSIVTCCGLLRELRHERHGGRAAADHDDALAVVVDVVRPLLRMDDAAVEALDAAESPGV